MFLLKPKILIIERYLWGETFGYFLLGAMGFTFFMIITSVFALGEKIFQKNIPPYTIAKVLMLSAPAFLVLAIPVAVLFSTLMAMGRLNRDNEIVAFQTNGVSLYRVFVPFFAMAVVAGIITWLIYENVVPPNNREYKEVLKVFWEAQVVEFIKPGIVIKAPQKKYFYVDEIRKEEVEGSSGTYTRSFMYGLRLYDYYGEGGKMRNFPRVFVAEKAWVADQFLVLSGVTLYNLDAATGDSLVSASMSEVKIDIGTRVVDYPLKPHPTELTAMALRNRIRQLRDRLAASAFPSPRMRQEYFSDWTEYYFKYSIPFACIAFVLVAVPVSLSGPRDERNLGIILSFILVLLYYIIFFSCRVVGARGVVLGKGLSLGGVELLGPGANVFPPLLAGWLAPAVFLVAGAVLVYRARK
jgi:lipopolysaccharide export LptBFGC system permease protein LptF